MCVSGSKKSISLSPNLIDPFILNQLTSLDLNDCIYDSKSLNFWSQSCVNLKTLIISFLGTSNLVDSDIENLLINCKKLSLFSTNYPVKSGTLKIISDKAQQLENVVFYSNEFFSPDLIEYFRSKMKKLFHFAFFVNKSMRMVVFSYDEESLCYNFNGVEAVPHFSASDIILYQQYVTLFSIPVQCQIVKCVHIPMCSEMLKSLTNKKIQLKELYVYDCNIPLVIDSLREVFQKCKQLVHFEYYDNINVMTAEHLQSLFSQQTTLQIIIFACNPNITAYSLEFMVQNSPLLTKLFLWKTRGLDLTTLNVYMNDVKSDVKFAIYD
jgi:hypothetical protein